MNRPYTIDFDGLDGINNLTPPLPSENEEKKITAFVEQDNAVTANDEPETQTKEAFSLFRMATFLIICLIGYFYFIDDNLKSELRQGLKQFISSSKSLAKQVEGKNLLSDTKHSITVTPLGKNEDDFTVISDAKELANEAKKLDKDIPSILSSVSQVAPKTKVINNDAASNVNQTIEFVFRFKFDSGPFTEMPNAKLIVLNDFVQHCQDTIKVVGHTDDYGSLLYNQAVGLEKATWIKDLLVQRGGLSVDRIKAYTAGPDNPIASNKTFAGRARNQRVVVSCLIQSNKN